MFNGMPYSITRRLNSYPIDNDMARVGGRVGWGGSGGSYVASTGGRIGEGGIGGGSGGPTDTAAASTRNGLGVSTTTRSSGVGSVGGGGGGRLTTSTSTKSGRRTGIGITGICRRPGVVGVFETVVGVSVGGGVVGAADVFGAVETSVVGVSVVGAIVVGGGGVSDAKVVGEAVGGSVADSK